MKLQIIIELEEQTLLQLISQSKRTSRTPQDTASLYIETVLHQLTKDGEEGQSKDGQQRHHFHQN